MDNKERFLSVLNYEKFDRIPVIHFGFWGETLQKWYQEGKITKEEHDSRWEGFPTDNILNEKLGFDFNYQNMICINAGLLPAFEPKIIEEQADGFKKILNPWGAIELHRGEAGSIPAEVGHIFSDRESFEEHFRHRLQVSEDRVPQLNEAFMKLIDDSKNPVALHCGSLFGEIRNWLGVQGCAYLFADDEEMFTEVIDIVGDLSYRATESLLRQTTNFSFAHFWEDICFKNGPLITPRIFDEKVGPHYKKISELLNRSGINIISVDCDGMIDSLIPTWINNGVNTMFPIEVGTWEASIEPWRAKYGKDIRGVGGMNKNVFALDYSAIDKEVERLKQLVELGGYIPCPDHRIPPDAIFENVEYYCEKIKRISNN